jgi:hypothetical protein
MPPLTEGGERLSPRATWSCIDERHRPAGRSHVAESTALCQGSGLAASLAPRPWHEQRGGPPTEPQVPKDAPIEPPALVPAHGKGNPAPACFLSVGC